MKILIDLQRAQTESRSRGIGRYAISITRAIIRNKESHEVHVLLNNILRLNIHQLYSELRELLPTECIHVWTGYGESAHSQSTGSRERGVGRYPLSLAKQKDPR